MACDFHILNYVQSIEQLQPDVIYTLSFKCKI